MDANVKEKWLEALEGGKYQQGRGTLRSDKNEYCCLGVLCDLVNPDGWDERPTRTETHDEDGPVLSYRHAFLYLMAGTDVLAQAGLDRAWAGRLAEMNDNGSLFPAIAQYIRETL